MNHELEVSLEFIKEFEGCHTYDRKTGLYRPYYCPAGVLTIGWGATGSGITFSSRWTKAQCDERLKKDVYQCMVAVKKLLPNATGGLLVACTSFAYNVGINALKNSTLRRKVLRGDLQCAKKEFLKWKFAGGRELKGLLRRRQAEADLF